MDSKRQTIGHYACVVIGTGFGLGLSPIAPGTFSALLGVLIHVAVISILPAKLWLLTLVSVFILICIIHFRLTPWAVKYWGSKDPKNFVLDEVAGYLMVPILFQHGRLWQTVIYGFLIFRIFDIIKIPPAWQIDRKMNGAWGILLDDIVSAIYAVIVMFFLMAAGLVDT